jgi:anaerobic magnesium-protoporphyrin IX monomethyl ester cyclase
VKTALIYPPAADPTAPYLAVPMLTGFLRAHGKDVLAIDANVEGFDWLLSHARLAHAEETIQARLLRLEERESLDHAEAMEHAALVDVLGECPAVTRGVDDAKSILRHEPSFFDLAQYGDAVHTIDRALAIVSAAHFPLQMDFSDYRTPFGLLSMEELVAAAEEGQNPFFFYTRDILVPRLVAADIGLVGISTAFPGQLLPAYAMAFLLRRFLPPQVHLTVGGPGATQMLIRLKGDRLAQALGPFDSAVVFEGEHTLLDLVNTLESRAPLENVGNLITRRDGAAGYRAKPSMEDLRKLPAPDFSDFPLSAYFSPRTTLPYDPTRGCYWGKCTFCHYGLAEVGTASYRERLVPTMVDHLRALSEAYGTKHFYLSQDSVAPKTLVKFAEGVVESGLDIRWGTDLKAEKYLTQERADLLKKAGAVACAVGVESASNRVLKLIDKGPPVSVITDAMTRLDQAGIAAEAMLFTDFPTENFDEASETLNWVETERDRIATYIVGVFGLTHGSLVAKRPADFGIAETYEVSGDDLGLGIFFSPSSAWKTEEERAELEVRMAELSERWYLRRYPWAGAVSTAHTLLFYDRFGRDVFRTMAETPSRLPKIVGSNDSDSNGQGDALVISLRFAPEDTSEAASRDGALWSQMIERERRVSRARWQTLSAELPPVLPSKARWLFRPGEAPERVGRSRGERPRHQLAPSAH